MLFEHMLTLTFAQEWVGDQAPGIQPHLGPFPGKCIYCVCTDVECHVPNVQVLASPFRVMKLLSEYFGYLVDSCPIEGSSTNFLPKFKLN